MVFPNSTALGLTRHGACAGATTALMGVVQFVVQAVASPLTGLASGTSAMPMAVVVLVLNLGGLTALLTLTRERRGVPSTRVGAVLPVPSTRRGQRPRYPPLRASGSRPR